MVINRTAPINGPLSSATTSSSSVLRRSEGTRLQRAIQNKVSHILQSDPAFPSKRVIQSIRSSRSSSDDPHSIRGKYIRRGRTTGGQLSVAGRWLRHRNLQLDRDGKGNRHGLGLGRGGWTLAGEGPGDLEGVGARTRAQVSASAAAGDLGDR